MKTYQELMAQHRDEVEAFPMAFAFSDKQLTEALEKLGATLEEVTGFHGGGVLRKTDVDSFIAMIERHSAEQTKAFEDYDTLVSAIRYQLGNHEYGYTGDSTDALRHLGLDRETMTEWQESCYQKARRQFINEDMIDDNEEAAA